MTSCTVDNLGKFITSHSSSLPASCHLIFFQPNVSARAITAQHSSLWISYTYGKVANLKSLHFTNPNGDRLLLSVATMCFHIIGSSNQVKLFWIFIVQLLQVATLQFHATNKLRKALLICPELKISFLPETAYMNTACACEILKNDWLSNGSRCRLLSKFKMIDIN